MSSATYLPRCPHRVATRKVRQCFVLLLLSLFGYTTTTESLHGQELFDYRLVDPASHMQPWPDDKADILIEPPASIRIATKWRTNRKDSREEKTAPPSVPSETPQLASRLPEPMPAQPSEKAEVLAPPVTPKDASAQQHVTGDCYAAPPLAALSASIALPVGKLPTDAAALCAAQIPPTGDTRLVGGWGCTEHHWSATCMHHRPLYFEEINAERYGYTVSYAFQPVISAAKFFATIPALPYKMVVERPRDCIYTLGYYRPGSCVPRRCNRLPWNFTAGAVESGVVAGLILLIP